MSLISRKEVLEYLDKRRTYELMDGRNKAYGKGIRDAIKDIEAQPSVPAVPLDKLCEWLSESSMNIPCSSCANFVNEYCTAIGDKSRPCPNSADDWRRAITEWTEEQDEAD